MAPLLVRTFPAPQPYLPIWQAMRDFVDGRQADSADECWLLEHQPVYTQGQAGRAEHLLRSSEIPLVHSDRGGQITYHGPGQLVFYLLLDLQRAHIGVRRLVSILEQSLIELLDEHGIAATARDDAPGVYVDQRKLASLGLRIRRHCSYHGMAINYDLDLSPFAAINPCGHAGLRMTRIRDLAPALERDQLSRGYLRLLARQLDLRPVWIDAPDANETP
jgi:lipoyl(octanoyl) transferase